MLDVGCSTFDVLCRKHRDFEKHSKHSRAFRLPLRHEVGERAGERWCSGNRGRSFLQSMFDVRRSVFPGSLFDTHAIKEPTKGGKVGEMKTEAKQRRLHRNLNRITSGTHRVFSSRSVNALFFRIPSSALISPQKTKVNPSKSNHIQLYPTRGVTLPTLDFGLRPLDCGLWTVDSGQQIRHCTQPPLGSIKQV